VVGSAGDFFGGVGDHARQDQAHSDRQQSHCYEDVLEACDKGSLTGVDIGDGQQIAGPV
jgi:hypothetical protein